jgi:hypothetical protein
MLPDAEQVNEPQVHHFDAIFADELEAFFGGVN